MKILSLHIENFGKLHNYDHVFSDGLNVIENANAWGKTTLAVFIKAMFYGMDKKGNSKAYDAERSKYSPWQGGTYGGSLIFEVNDKKYRVLRTFAPTPEGDRFELLDLQTNKISKDFSTNLGEELFEVGKETFCITTFFAQGDINSQINDEVRSHLSGASVFSGDAERYSKAVKKLKEFSHSLLVATPKIHEVYAYQENIEIKKQQLENLNGQKEVLTEQIQQLEENLKNSQEQEKPAPANDNSQVKTQQLSNLKTQREDIEKQLGAKQKQNSSSKTKLWFLFGFAITLAVLSLVLSLTGQASYLTASVGAVAGVLLIIFIIFFVKFKKEGAETIIDLQNKLQELNIQISQVEQQIILIATGAQQNMSELSKRAEQNTQLAVDKIRLKQIEAQIDALVEEIDELEVQLLSMQQLRQENINKQEIVKNVLGFLEQARDSLSQRFVQPMQQKFDGFLQKLEEKGQIKLNTDLDVLLDTQTGVKEDKYLSHGKRDLVTICKRFALIESVFQKQKPFVILDDPFVNLDESSLKNMLNLVDEYSKNYQIIYLICHHSRAK